VGFGRYLAKFATEFPIEWQLTEEVAPRTICPALDQIISGGGRAPMAVQVTWDRVPAITAWLRPCKSKLSGGTAGKYKIII